MIQQTTESTSEPAVTITTGQTLHFVCLAGLLTATAATWSAQGRPHPVLFWTAVAIPVLHQSFVWIAWRRAIARSSPPAASVFRLYLVSFFVLFGARFVSLLALGWQDFGSLSLSVWLQVLLTVCLLLPGIATMVSVLRWFGFARAAGADHFDPKYRSMPLVRRGMFRWSSNAMYTFAFLLFWAIAIGFNSRAALIVAAFSHAYIWVHYHATERPDMDFLYSDTPLAG